MTIADLVAWLLEWNQDSTIKELLEWLGSYPKDEKLSDFLTSNT